MKSVIRRDQRIGKTVDPETVYLWKFQIWGGRKKLGQLQKVWKFRHTLVINKLCISMHSKSEKMYRVHIPNTQI